jgi:hypothetical protein
MNATNHPAVQVLEAFFAEMNRWGAEAIRQYEAIDWGNVDQEAIALDRRKQREALTAIYERYCDIGGNAERLQDEGIAIKLDRPEYDPLGEDVISVMEKSGVVVVETKQNQRPNWKFRYELVSKEGEWRVRDTRKRCSEQNPKWKRDML